VKAPLDELYFRWLYGQVANSSVDIPSRTYWRLLKLLYTKEFVWFVPNDDNRIEDGKDLRYEFADQERLEIVDRGWLHLGCSFLELLIALSRRLSFEAEGEPRDWFWHMLENIGLHIYNDQAALPFQDIDEILDQVIWRTYKHNGVGGLFPLEGPCQDQRHIELWYQLSAYILERI
jgi:hypothetical protein